MNPKPQDWTPPIAKSTGKPCQTCTKNQAPCCKPHAKTTPGPRPGGRPTKLTPEFIQRAGEIIAEGTLVKLAWARLNIDQSTWYAWLKQGAEDQENGVDSPAAEFSRTIANAESVAHDYYARLLSDNLIDRVIVHEGEKKTTIVPAHSDPETGTVKTGSVNHYATLQYLARRWPDDWSEKRRVALEGSDGGPVKAEFRVVLSEGEDDDEDA